MSKTQSIFGLLLFVNNESITLCRAEYSYSFYGLMYGSGDEKGAMAIVDASLSVCFYVRFLVRESDIPIHCHVLLIDYLILLAKT